MYFELPVNRISFPFEMKVAIFTSMHNVGYFSNFFYCAFGRPYAQVVTPEKNVSISAMIDAGQPWRTTIGDNLVYTDWGRDNFLVALKEVIGNDIKFRRVPTNIEEVQQKLADCEKLTEEFFKNENQEEEESADEAYGAPENVEQSVSLIHIFFNFSPCFLSNV